MIDCIFFGLWFCLVALLTRHETQKILFICSVLAPIIIIIITLSIAVLSATSRYRESSEQIHSSVNWIQKGVLSRQPGSILILNEESIGLSFSLLPILKHHISYCSTSKQYILYCSCHHSINHQYINWKNDSIKLCMCNSNIIDIVSIEQYSSTCFFIFAATACNLHWHWLYCCQSVSSIRLKFKKGPVVNSKVIIIIILVMRSFLVKEISLSSSEIKAARTRRKIDRRGIWRINAIFGDIDWAPITRA